MISKKQKTMIVGISSLIPLILGGCASPAGNVKPDVRAAVARPGNTYVIQQASVHTPATDRLWQQRRAERAQQLDTKRAHLLAVSKQRQQAAAAKQASKPAVQGVQGADNSAAAAKVIQQQNVLRAQYHARYQARQAAAEQQAAEKLRAAQANKVARAAPAQRQRPATNQQPRASRTQPVKNIPQKTAAASPRDQYVKRWEQEQARTKLERKIASKKADLKVERVIHNAKEQIGSKYVWGGASPKTGFDCSGLVQHSIAAGANVKVPRTAAEQYSAAVKVSSQQASRGDLIFFKTRGNSVSHVGIYLGDEKFVHAPRTGLKVTTSQLSGYWKERFVGFGRIPGACKVPV